MIEFLYTEYSGSSSVTQSTCNINSAINECPANTTTTGTIGTTGTGATGTTGTTDTTGATGNNVHCI